jgi:spermidine/putrescine transport system permease protein
MNKPFKEILSDEFHFFMAMPAIAWQILFFYIPVALVILLSFVKTVHVQGAPIFTLEHYSALMAPLFFWVIARSLVLAFVTACICLLLAYPVAYVLAVKIERYKNIFLFFLILPFWTSLMVQVYSWFFVLEHNGLLNSIFLKLGLVSQPIHMLNTTFSIYLVMVYCYLPFMIFPLYTALEKVDKKMFEAAADLGASQLQTFAKVTLPLSMPGVKTGFFLVFVPSFGEFVVPTLLGGGEQLFVGSLITQYFLSARNPYLGAAFTCLSGLVLLISIVLLYWFFNGRVGLRSQTKGQR